MTRKNLFVAWCAIFAMVVAPVALADHHEGGEKEAKKLKVGDDAPDFKLPKQGDKDDPPMLSGYEGKRNVVLAFYPKAFTGGCTTQLCGYRDNFVNFESAHTEVVAISTDEQLESDRFKEEYKFPFTVMGDTDADVVKKYGVGRNTDSGNVMAQRAVFVVNKEGKIAYIDREYQVKGDAAPLYAAIHSIEEEGGLIPEGSTPKAHDHGEHSQSDKKSDN